MAITSTASFQSNPTWNWKRRSRAFVASVPIGGQASASTAKLGQTARRKAHEPRIERAADDTTSKSNSANQEIVIDLTFLTVQSRSFQRSSEQFRLDPQAGVVHVASGVRLRVLYTELAKSAVTVAAGQCSPVCLGGLVGTGGVGFSTRAFGYVCDQLASRCSRWRLSMHCSPSWNLFRNRKTAQYGVSDLQPGSQLTTPPDHNYLTAYWSSPTLDFVNFLIAERIHYRHGAGLASAHVRKLIGSVRSGIFVN